jgi:hypothetical protein
MVFLCWMAITGLRPTTGSAYCQTPSSKNPIVREPGSRRPLGWAPIGTASFR